MTLNVNHQLALLHDLLDEQHTECCGQVSEYQQIKRLVKSIMANNLITDAQLVQLLPEIYNYSLQGESIHNSTEHITMNQENIQSWINAIQQTKLE